MHNKTYKMEAHLSDVFLIVLILICNGIHEPRQRSQVQLPTVPFSYNDYGQVVHIQASVNKQYNSKRLNGGWCTRLAECNVSWVYKQVTCLTMGIGSSPMYRVRSLHDKQHRSRETLNNCNNNSRKDTEIQASPIQKPSFSHNAPCYFLNIQKQKIGIQNWFERNQMQPLNSGRGIQMPFNITRSFPSSRGVICHSERWYKYGLKTRVFRFQSSCNSTREHNVKHPVQRLYLGLQKHFLSQHNVHL